MAKAASRLAWNSSVAKIIDIAVALLIVLATASRSLEKAATDMVYNCRHKYAAEENVCMRLYRH